MYNLTLIGNLTIDPTSNEREWTNKETGEVFKNNVCNFTVAANEGYGAYRKTQYFKIAAWRGLADICQKNLKKGRCVYINGVPSLNNYVDKSGNLHSSIEVRADRIDFLSDGKRFVATEDGVQEDTDTEEALY